MRQSTTTSAVAIVEQSAFSRLIVIKVRLSRAMPDMATPWSKRVTTDM